MFFNDLHCRFYNVCYYNLSLWEILKNQSLNEDVKIDILKEINEIKYTHKIKLCIAFFKNRVKYFKLDSIYISIMKNKKIFDIETQKFK